MGNGKAGTIERMNVKLTNREDKCKKVIANLMGADKVEDILEIHRDLKSKYRGIFIEIENHSKGQLGEVEGKLKNSINEIRKDEAVAAAIASDISIDGVKKEGNASINAGKLKMEAAKNAQAEIDKINEMISNNKKLQGKSHYVEEFSVSKQATGIKQLVKEAMGAVGEIVKKFAYAAKSEPYKVTAGTALVAIGIASVTEPVGVMTAVGIVTAAYGASMLWKCGPVHVLLKNLKQLDKYESKSE